MDWEFDAEVRTSLIPKDGVYLVPLKVALRRPEGIDDGDVVRVHLSVGERATPHDYLRPPRNSTVRRCSSTLP